MVGRHQEVHLSEQQFPPRSACGLYVTLRGGGTGDFKAGKEKLPVGGLATVGGRAELRGYPQKKMETAMTIAFPPLPYAQDALAPHISADTLATHHGQHHKAYS